MVDYLIMIFSRFCLLLFFTSHVWIATSSLQDKRLVTRIIHHDSIFSPYYDESSTISDRASFAVESSMARLAYLKAKANGVVLSKIRGPLIPSSRGGVFYLNVSIGDPPIPQFVAMDTGSDLFWVQCQPCSTCHKTANPIYNPRRSSTFTPLACHMSECAKIYDGKCDLDGYCAYVVSYLDDTNSTGVIAYEKFTFVAGDKGVTIAPNVIFGCGTKNYFNLFEGSGILGLSANKGSVVSSFGYKFSYCLGNISDRSYTSNNLILGEGAVIEGYSTPFRIRQGVYFVSLEGISVGQTKIATNPEEFKYKVLLDTGTTLSYLARSVYEPLKAEVQKIINGSLEVVKVKNSPDLLCYKGILERDARGFPTVTFHLAQNTDIDLEIEGFFFKLDEDTFCMAANADDDAFNIIGIIAQQYYNVGYDLKAKRVSFERIDCNVFEDSFS